jgi:hypothetical protein
MIEKQFVKTTRNLLPFFLRGQRKVCRVRVESLVKQPDYEQGIVGTPAGCLGDSLKQENILLLWVKRPMFQEFAKFVENNQNPGPALSLDYLSARVAHERNDCGI